MSSLLEETVEIPLPSAKYEQLLKKMISASRFKKKVVKKNIGSGDFSKSFPKAG